MVSLLAALLVGSSSEPQVAFIARFYYPPGDKRISHPQLYVCRLDGSRRRQLTFDREEKWNVQWRGRNQLVYWAPGRGLRVFDLRRRCVVRKMAEGKDPDETGLRGRPSTDWTNLVGFQKWEWTSGQGDEINLMNEADGCSMSYRVGGKRFTVGYPGFLQWLIRCPKKECDYLIANAGGGSGGDEVTLCRFEPRKGKVTRVLNQVGALDFDPRSRYWSAPEAGHPLSPYGDKQVWTSEAYVGDFMTGRRWPIAKGLVNATGIQIRPGI